MPESPPPTITRNHDSSRFEAHLDGRRVGLIDYLARGRNLVFTHTEVDPAFEGSGIGSALVSAALGAASEEGKKVVPLCPFVARWIEEHPGYDELVDHAALDAVGPPVEEE